MKWRWVSYSTLSSSSIIWLMVKVLFNLNVLPLMRSRTEKHLPVYICRMELKHNEELYNDILGYLERLGIGWTVDVFESFGKKLVTLLQNAHRDSHYVAALYKYKKQMVAKYCQFSMFVYIPVGKCFISYKTSLCCTLLCNSKVGHC